MGEKHLSRLAMPRTWKIKRKGIKWVTRPSPGPHPFKRGLPINCIFRDNIKIAEKTKEVKNILQHQEVLVDGVRRKDHRFIVGVMDVIAIPKIKAYYRILFNKKGHITAFPIKPEEAKFKPGKITGKTSLKKGKQQLNLYDGKNILTEKNSFKVGDSALIELPSLKIKEPLKLEKGALVYLMGGKHIGETGIIEDIREKKIYYKRGDESFETLKEYAFVIGKGKPTITLPEE